MFVIVGNKARVEIQVRGLYRSYGSLRSLSLSPRFPSSSSVEVDQVTNDW
jgi:hypothetical protein